MATTVNGAAKGPQRVTIAAVSDGGQVGAITLTNAQVLALLFGNGPLNDMWERSYTNQAAARLALLSGVTGQAKDRGFCAHAIRALNNTGAATWAVDVNVDGSGLPTLTITPSAASSTGIIELEAIWTSTR